MSGAGSGGGRLRVSLRKGKGRTASSRQWLERQLNDPFVERAKREGFRSRAAFKLIEIDDRAKLLRPGARVLDLGAAPGGWSQVAARRIGSTEGRGHVVALDILPMDPIAGVVAEILDVRAPDAPERITRLLGGRADVVLSDMAANTTGHRQTDHLRTTALLEAAADLALEVLTPGGAFVAKVFRGGSEGEILARLKQTFATVKHVKPAASRSESVELYVVATGFRGAGEAQPGKPAPGG